MFQQKLQERPPGLKTQYVSAGNVYDQYHTKTLEDYAADINTDVGYHWGIPINEIKPSFNIYAVERDIEKTINGIDQVIEQGWEKIKVSVDSAAVDTVAPPKCR